MSDFSNEKDPLQKRPIVLLGGLQRMEYYRPPGLVGWHMFVWLQGERMTVYYPKKRQREAAHNKTRRTLFGG